jgi:hypothetical protein
MSNSRSSLGTLELFSVGGAVVGSVIAAVTNQAIIGLAPVSLSLVLNLINRRRLETFLDQNADVTGEVQQLRRDVILLGTTNEKVTQDLHNLAQKQELTPSVAKVEELHQQQEGLRLSLVPLQSRLDDLIQQFNSRPELEAIESLAVVIEALKQSIDQLPQPLAENTVADFPQNSESVEKLQKAIELLHYQFNNRPELVKIEHLSVITETLQQSINLFSVYNQTPLSREFQEEVAASMTQLAQNSQQVERLKQTIILLEHQFDRKILELSQESLTKS